MNNLTRLSLSIILIFNTILTSNTPARENNIWKDKLIAQSRKTSITSMKYYDLGVFGKLKESTVFISTVNSLPNWTRTYWAIVRILSDKYGCYMQKKLHLGTNIAFKCKDGRIVAFQYGRKGRFRFIKGSQFDKNGNSLYIINHEKIHSPTINKH